jgi:hypothetical protein
MAGGNTIILPLFYFPALKELEWISTVMSEFYVEKYLTPIKRKLKEIDLTKM